MASNAQIIQPPLGGPAMQLDLFASFMAAVTEPATPPPAVRVKAVKVKMQRPAPKKIVSFAKPAKPAAVKAKLESSPEDSVETETRWPESAGGSNSFDGGTEEDGLEQDVILTNMTDGVTFKQKVGSITVTDGAGRQYYQMQEFAQEYFKGESFRMKVMKGWLFPHYAAAPDGTTLHLGNLERELALASA